MVTDAKLYGRDQYGNTWGPIDPKAPKASLLREIGRRSATPMYVDKKDGRTLQVGYVVRPERGTHETELWVSFYWETVEPWERDAR